MLIFFFLAFNVVGCLHLWIWACHCFVASCMWTHVLWNNKLGLENSGKLWWGALWTMGVCWIHVDTHQAHISFISTCWGMMGYIPPPSPNVPLILPSVHAIAWCHFAIPLHGSIVLQCGSTVSHHSPTCVGCFLLFFPFLVASMPLHLDGTSPKPNIPILEPISYHGSSIKDIPKKGALTTLLLLENSIVRQVIKLANFRNDLS